MSVAQLAVDVVANTDDFSRRLSGVERQTHKFVGSMKRLSRRFMFFIGIATGAFAAARALAAMGDEMRRVAREAGDLGLSLRQLQQLQLASDMANAPGFLEAASERIRELQEGLRFGRFDDSAMLGMEALGTSFAELAKAGGEAEQTLALLEKIQARTKDLGIRREFFRIFGLDPKAADNLDALVEELRQPQTGTAANMKGVNQRLSNLSKAWKRFSTAFGQFLKIFASWFAPLFTTILNVFAEFFEMLNALLTGQLFTYIRGAAKRFQENTSRSTFMEDLQDELGIGPKYRADNDYTMPDPRVSGVAQQPEIVLRMGSDLV